MTGALILDRDGVLIEAASPGQYLRSWQDVRPIRGSIRTLFSLRDFGIRPILVMTNQSGIGRGVVRWDEVLDANRAFLDIASSAIDGFYLCPHAPEDDCDCRKPRDGMVRRAMFMHDFDPEKSLVVGDHHDDMGLAEAIGAEFILVKTGRGDSCLADLEAAAFFSIVADFRAAAPMIRVWWWRQMDS